MPEETGAGYRFLEHTSDAYIEAQGSTLEESFAQAAKAFYETMVNVESVEPKTEELVNVQGHDDKELLYNWLEALLLRFDIDGTVYSRFNVSPISEQPGLMTLHARISGERYDRQKHGAKVEVKGITYHLMIIDRIPGRTVIRFLLDL